MSHPQPPQRQPTPNEADKYIKVLHNTAIAALVACPLLIALPPRKLDFFTFGLGGATLYSADFLLREQTGRGIWQHINRSQLSQEPMKFESLPTTERANLSRELAGAESELRRVKGKVVSGVGVTEEVKSQRDAWKAEREREIKEDVEEGKGFGDMIIDQVWEVWNWGKPKEDDDDEDV